MKNKSRIPLSVIKLRNQLSWKEKEALNILCLEHIRRYPIHERPPIEHLIQQVANCKLTIKWTDEMIEKEQTLLLNRELMNYKKANKLFNK